MYTMQVHAHDWYWNIGSFHVNEMKKALRESFEGNQYKSHFPGIDSERVSMLMTTLNSILSSENVRAQFYDETHKLAEELKRVMKEHERNEVSLDKFAEIHREQLQVIFEKVQHLKSRVDKISVFDAEEIQPSQ
jgi:hypothetical protein